MTKLYYRLPNGTLTPDYFEAIKADYFETVYKDVNADRFYDAVSGSKNTPYIYYEKSRWVKT